MLRLIILLVVAYFAYRYYGWPVAAGVVAAYLLLILILGAVNARSMRRKADLLVRQKMSDAEKAHLGAVQEHQEAMEEHKAMFDPELRKSRGQPQ